MARTKGSYSLSANIEINAAAPLDARERVATLADLTAEGSFPYHYVGMETYVVATGKKYRLTGSDPTVSANWVEIGEGGSGYGGHTIENASGTDMTARANLQFKGAASVSDDSENDRTVVDVPVMPSSDMSEIIRPLPTPSTGTTVVPNPSEPATASLTKLQVGDTVYGVSGGSNDGVIYGFRIEDGESNPSSKVSYLKDAVGMSPSHMNYTTGAFSWGSWADAFFIPKPCMLKYDGTVDYYLDPGDYTKKEDGTASDVANTSYAGNAMMEWGQNGKKIWLKIEPDQTNSSSANIYIADHKADNNFVDYAFHNCNGDSVDHFYTSIYNGSLINNKLRSLSGQQVMNSTLVSDGISYATANNTTASEIWNIEKKSDIDLINILLILMSKTTDSQTAFGQGLSVNGSESINNAFRTGVHNAKGLFYGTNSGTASTYTNAVKVFGMENYWGLNWRRYLGHVNENGTQKIKLTYGQEDGSTADGFNVTGNGYISINSAVSSGTSGGYISKYYFSNNTMVPLVASGSSSTYYCDGLWFNNSSGMPPSLGFTSFCGSSLNGTSDGALAINISSAISYTDWTQGMKLSAKPLS